MLKNDNISNGLAALSCIRSIDYGLQTALTREGGWITRKKGMSPFYTEGDNESVRKKAFHILLHY